MQIKNISGDVIINVPGETLRGACLGGANLSGADLRDVDLSGADLRGADLSGADLSGADLSGADLSGANLRWADLRNVNLRDVDLSGADLRGIDLRGANLSGADLSGANLRGAYLREADLSEVSGFLEVEKMPIRKAIYDRVCATPENLEMNDWHTCDTVHCLAGWAVTIHPQGGELENRLGTSAAASLIFQVCEGEIPDFYSDKKTAIKWLKK